MKRGNTNTVVTLESIHETLQELKSMQVEWQDFVKTTFADEVEQVSQPPPEKIDTEEAYTFLEISETTFYEHVYKRLLFPIKIGSRNYFIREELYDLLRRRKESKLPYRLLEPMAENDLDLAA